MSERESTVCVRACGKEKCVKENRYKDDCPIIAFLMRSRSAVRKSIAKVLEGRGSVEIWN